MGLLEAIVTTQRQFTEAHIQNVTATNNKNAKKTVIIQLSDQARLELIRGSTVRTSIEPTVVVPSCAQLVEASS
jgi:superfamily II DNA helicase RecQ